MQSLIRRNAAHDFTNSLTMPPSLHGGRGRADGGKKRGGRCALNFDHRRAAIQASKTVVASLNTW